MNVALKAHIGERILLCTDQIQKKMNIKLFAWTKSIISAIPERRLSHGHQRNEYGHVRHRSSLFGREGRLLTRSKTQRLIQGHRICCSSCPVKIIILIYNVFCWQEGNIEMVLRLQAPACSRTMSQLMMSWPFFRPTMFLSSSNVSVCDR